MFNMFMSHKSWLRHPRPVEVGRDFVSFPPQLLKFYLDRKLFLMQIFFVLS